MTTLQTVLDQIAKDDTGVAIPILQRNGKPYLAADGSKATITVIGSESTRFRKARTAVYRKSAESPQDDDEINAASRIALAASAVTGWHGWESSNGTPLLCEPKNVEVLLSVEHILAQVEAGIRRSSDFFADGSTG